MTLAPTWGVNWHPWVGASALGLTLLDSALKPDSTDSEPQLCQPEIGGGGGRLWAAEDRLRIQP